MDLEYMICFYSMELNWSKSEGELWIKEGIQMHIIVSADLKCFLWGSYWWQLDVFFFLNQVEGYVTRIHMEYEL